MNNGSLIHRHSLVPLSVCLTSPATSLWLEPCTILFHKRSFLSVLLLTDKLLGDQLSKLVLNFWLQCNCICWKSNFKNVGFLLGGHRPLGPVNRSEAVFSSAGSQQGIQGPDTSRQFISILAIGTNRHLGHRLGWVGWGFLLVLLEKSRFRSLWLINF